jgi:hypothetical protein
MDVKEVQELIAREGVGAETPNFAANGDPMGPGNCHWCGARLNLCRLANHPTIASHRDARGAYGDNSFCGLRCGYAFGVQMAVLGRRLEVKS